jgi:hypothetical protein
MVLDRVQDFLLAVFLRDVERNEATLGQPDIGDDGAISVVVEMKEGLRLKLELRRSWFTQLAEPTKLVQEIGNSFESSPTALPRSFRLHEAQLHGTTSAAQRTGSQAAAAQEALDFEPERIRSSQRARSLLGGRIRRLP